MEHPAPDRDPELGEENVFVKNESKCQPGVGWQNSNAVNEPVLPVVQPDHFGVTNGTGPLFRDKDGTMRNLPRSVAESVGIDKDLWEKLNRDKPAYVLEFMAELDRMLSSLCLHKEQNSAHNRIGSRMAYRMHQLTAFHLLFVGVMCYAFFAGYVDGRPRSIATYVMGAEIGWYIAQFLLKMWERYEHDKRAQREFCFKLDFQNLPALKEVVGDQKWKGMQECSDHIRVLEDLNDIVSSSRQSQGGSSPSTEC